MKYQSVAAASACSMIVTALGMVVAPAASAATCTGGVRYAATSNVTYLTEATSYTLSSIASACPSAPIKLVDAASKTWLISSDLVLQNGATLTLKGAAAGGDANTVRLRSRASNALTEVQALTAQWGTIDADSVTVTSWDDEAGAPDTHPDYVADKTMRGRAFVRALSVLDAAGTPRQSRMNIANSTFSNLGYYAAESYGVTYKSRQCSRDAVAACAQAPVTGFQKNSSFTNNYMGVYLWGASHMEFSGSHYDNNVMYGWDGHDVSTDMTVTGNTFSGNGDHGWICSQLCDKLTVTGNTASRNGMVPWGGPDPDNQGSNQVHGMMLHRGITNTVLADNVVTEHPNGAGIAVFDTEKAVVRGNRVEGAMFGIRISVGSRDNLFQANTVTGSTANGVFSYAGNDTATYTNSSGRPSGNRFVSNTFDRSAGSVIKLADSDGFAFESNAVHNVSTPVEIVHGAGHTFTSNAFTAGQRFVLVGAPERRTSVTIAPSAGIAVEKDAYSTATLR